MGKLSGLEPKEVFEYFEQICAIPHGSANTDAISSYCVDFAKKHGLEHYRDELNNVIIKKSGIGNKPVILQGHLDMVCEKTQESTINFDTDGLNIYTDGDFIRAYGTTLGGDDGIAVAYILAILASDDIVHPPIEAVFTVDEETGMYGAYALDVSRLSGKTILNIDSEDEGIFTSGCAGGVRMSAVIPVKRETRIGAKYRVEVSGLLGGHSGTEINKNRANAVKFLAELLYNLPIYITVFAGGTKTNAIPASAYAEFVVDTAASAEGYIAAAINERAKKFAERFSDPNISVRISEIGRDEISAAVNTADILDFIHSAEDGVIAMNADGTMPETSSNLGITELCENEFRAQLLIRSNVNAEKTAASKRVIANAAAHGGIGNTHDDYPAWEYSEKSPFRDTLAKAYRELYGSEPKIVTIHAGLECGIFAEKIAGADCVSIGPDLFDIHTPNESLSISSAERTWNLIRLALRYLADEKNI